MSEREAFRLLAGIGAAALVLALLTGVQGVEWYTLAPLVVAVAIEAAS